MNDAGKAVFLSYASQDAEAAKRICDALRAGGVEVWFDQSELVGGDAWDQKIRKQIKDCALLIPIISAATQERTEGYFRLEWRLADQRTHLMAKGRAFLLPVVIDGTRDAEAHVPDSFAEVQWTRLRLAGYAGQARSEDEDPGLAAFAARVKRLLTGNVAGVADPGRAYEDKAPGSATPATAQSPKWLRPILASAVVVVTVLAVTLFKIASQSELPPGPAALVSAKPEFPRDPELKRARQLIYAAGAIPGDFSLAEDMVKPLLAARPNDPEVVTIAAEISEEFVARGFDTSDARKALAQKLTERAVSLAPDNPVALAALGRYLLFLNSQLPRAEDLLRHAIELAPDEPRYYRMLHTILAVTKPGTETEAFQARMVAKFPRDALVQYDIARRYKDENNLAAMEEWIDRTLTLSPITAALVWKSWLLLDVHSDAAGMKATLESIPERQRLVPRVVAAYAECAGITGDTGKALQLLNSLGDTWLSDFDFTGPKSLLIGNLLRQDGRDELARLQYKTALAEIERAEAQEPTNMRLRRAEMWAQLGVGDHDKAVAALRLVAQGTRQPSWTINSSWWNGIIRAALLLGERDQALALLKQSATTSNGRLLLRNQFKQDPRMKPFHDDPEINALLNEPAGQKTQDGTLSPVQAPDAKSVAVLAFVNLSDDKANEYFSDGISEELLNVLVKVPGLKVSARTSAFYFKGKEVPVPEIAKQLGVAYVVEGSVRKSGDKVRITAQLIKAADGFHVWSDTFTRDVKDIFGVQDEIAGLIAKNLELKMGFVRTSAKETINSDAYQEYLLGRASASKASMADLREAVMHFSKAVALEPKFTAAWVQLATAHTQLGRWGGAPTLQSWQSARVAIDHAQELDPDSPEMLVALGWIRRTGEWNWRGAEQAFRRALQLRPNQPEVLAGAAVLLFNVGKTDEAFRLGKQAVRLDPLNPAAHIDLSIMFYLNGNPPEAEQAARRALQLAPSGASYHAILSWSLIAQKRFDEAAAEIELDPDPVENPTARGLLAIARGQPDEARRMIAQLEELARIQPDASDLQQSIAWLAAWLGDKEKAFATLEKARASRDPSMSWLRNGGYLRPLESDPRWEQMLRKLGLADDQLK